MTESGALSWKILALAVLAAGFLLSGVQPAQACTCEKDATGLYACDAYCTAAEIQTFTSGQGIGRIAAPAAPIPAHEMVPQGPAPAVGAGGGGQQCYQSTDGDFICPRLPAANPRPPMNNAATPNAAPVFNGVVNQPGETTQQRAARLQREALEAIAPRVFNPPDRNTPPGGVQALVPYTPPRIDVGWTTGAGLPLDQTAISCESGAPTPTPVPWSVPRNLFNQPFAVNSIWNMPIGTAARYVPANISGRPGGGDPWTSMPYADEDVIVLRPDAPMVAVRESAWAGDRCQVISGRVFATVPIPVNYTNPSSNHNMAAAVLMPDRQTLVQIQPLTRCNAGGNATSIVRWPDANIRGDGIAGAHGGSGMSSIGGTLRVGELRPGQLGPRHALKLIIFMREAYRCGSFNNCYRWPALTADGYALGHYGSSAVNAGNAALKMGALLAIPACKKLTELGLETEPARQLAWTLQNYGGYVVDDSWGAQFGFATETGPDGSFVDQFQSDYGYAFSQRIIGNTPWMRDVQRLVEALYVVDNNGPGSIGGGGTPLQPLAPDAQ